MKSLMRLLLTTTLLFPAALRAQPDEAKTWTFHAGLGSPKAWNYTGITREYFIDEHTTYFITAGLGTALVGGGLAYYGNREGNGVVASTAIGVVDLQATLAYQFKVGENDFITAGGSYGMFFMQCYCWLPVLSYEHRY